MSANQAIDDCYAVFAGYPAPTTIEASPPRDPVNILRMLTSASLRKLKAENLQEYAYSAMTTVGVLEDYKHFLPRILEIATTRDAYIQPETIALKLRYGELNSWPAAERQAIETVFRSAWRTGLSMHPDNRRVGCWLCAMAIIDMPLRHELEYCLQATGFNPGLQLATIITATIFEEDEMDRAYWGEVSDVSYCLATQFLSSAPVKKRLAATHLSCDPDDQWWIDKALVLLDKLSIRTFH